MYTEEHRVICRAPRAARHSALACSCSLLSPDAVQSAPFMRCCLALISKRDGEVHGIAMARYILLMWSLCCFVAPVKGRADPSIEARKNSPCAVPSDAKCRDWCATSAKETHCHQCECEACSFCAIAGADEAFAGSRPPALSCAAWCSKQFWIAHCAEVACQGCEFCGPGATSMVQSDANAATTASVKTGTIGDTTLAPCPALCASATLSLSVRCQLQTCKPCAVCGEQSDGPTAIVQHEGSTSALAGPKLPSERGTERAAPSIYPSLRSSSSSSMDENHAKDADTTIIGPAKAHSGTLPAPHVAVAGSARSEEIHCEAWCSREFASSHCLTHACESCSYCVAIDERTNSASNVDSNTHASHELPPDPRPLNSLLKDPI